MPVELNRVYFIIIAVLLAVLGMKVIGLVIDGLRVTSVPVVSPVVCKVCVPLTLTYLIICPDTNGDAMVKLAPELGTQDKFPNESLNNAPTPFDGHFKSELVVPMKV